MVRRAMLVAVAAVMLSPLPSRAGGDDPAVASQWALRRIGVQEAWSRTTGAGVRIGIVDTGVDLDHEDLAGQVVASTSCVGSGGRASACTGSARDRSGHGTHIAGIVAAVRGNGKGGAGVAPDARLVVARVFSAERVASVADVLAGIQWVVDHGAKVVNLSFGDPDMMFLPTTAANGLRKALDYAWSRGAVPVLAAGRYRGLGLNLADPSARTLHAVVVGATGPDNRLTDYSTPTGRANLALLAPGGTGTDPASGVFSAFSTPRSPNTYRVLTGTSMAAAHVSGAAALLLAEGYNGRGAVERLLATADGTVQCGMGSLSCWGLVDTARATEGPVQPASA